MNPTNPPSAAPKRLQRSNDRKLAGVCGGLADYFGVDATVVRLLFVAGLFFGAGSLLVYVVAWILMPEAPGSPAAWTGPAAAWTGPAAAWTGPAAAWTGPAAAPRPAPAAGDDTPPTAASA